MFTDSRRLKERLEELEAENRRLLQAVAELTQLNELARVISSTMAVDQILERVVHSAIKSIGAEQGVISLVEADREAPLRTLVRGIDTRRPGKPMRLNELLSGWLIKHKKPLVVHDLSRDERFKRVSIDADQVRTVLGVPLASRGRFLGVITLFNKEGGEKFSDDDVRMLSIIAAQSAQVIENARLHEQEKELQRIEQELEMAREMQAALLPKAAPQLPGFELSGMSVPARQVGGDYFDFIQIDENRWGIALGDVAGKGIPAALLMANLQALLRGEARMGHPPVETVARVNHLLYLNTEPRQFVTLFYGVLDVSRSLFEYVNAGHNYPLLVSPDGLCEPLSTGGLLLGIMPEYPYESATITLHPGQLLLVYSDGVNECVDAEDQEFGEDGIRAILAEKCGVSARAVCDCILERVQHHAAGQPQTDDITLVAVKATGSEPGKSELSAPTRLSCSRCWHSFANDTQCVIVEGSF
jgi:sigma-B regulation protein RsbU (phosphoserine phosphatase)